MPAMAVNLTRSSELPMAGRHRMEEAARLAIFCPRSQLGQEDRQMTTVL